MSWTDLEFELEQRADPDATIYHIRGTVTDTPSAFKLLDKVREGLSRGPDLHLLDLTDVPQMTSAGVGIVAAAYTTAQREKKRLILVAPSTRIESILAVVGLWSMIEHFETIDDALSS